MWSFPQPVLPELSLAAERMMVLARVAPLVDSGRLDDYLLEVLAESAKWATVPEIRDARNQLKTLVPPAGEGEPLHDHDRESKG